jgi:DNA-binding XRE family transcriptional regulator
MLDSNFAALLASEAKTSHKKIGERVRLARKSAGLTQQELSVTIGIDQAIISKMEDDLLNYVRTPPSPPGNSVPEVVPFSFLDNMWP